MLRQRVAAESLHLAALSEFHHSQQIPFQVRPAELGFALVIFQIGAEAVAAQDAPEHGSQQTDQHRATAGCPHRVDYVTASHNAPQATLAALVPPPRLT